MSVQSVLDFWYREITPHQWWRGQVNVDQMIRQRFADLHTRAGRGELAHWRATMRGRLAEIIVLDQFSRNLYRDQAAAYAQDGLALALAQEAIANGSHVTMPVHEQTFLYMPFMHAESLPVQMQSMQLHDRDGLEPRLYWAIRHRDVIRRFGRFPHRNAALGRPSSPAELDFLQTPNTSF